MLCLKCLKCAARGDGLVLEIPTTNSKMADFATGFTDMITGAATVPCHVADFVTLVAFSVEFWWWVDLLFIRMYHAYSQLRPLYRDTGLLHLKA